MKKNSPLTESMENYLKTILRLSEEYSDVMVKDIGRLMNVKTSSVTAALECLATSGHVEHEAYGYVKLTPSGRAKGWDVRKRHDMLLCFLKDVLEIDSRTAEKEACGMEHAISQETFTKLSQFIEFLKIGPKGQIRNCLSSFQEFKKSGARKACGRCLSKRR